MSLKSFIVKNVLRIKPGTVAADAAGELRVDSSDNNKLKYHNGTSEAQIIRADQISDITYDGTTSGLAATNVQAAIDEVDSDLDSHLADTTAAHAASAIAVTPTGNLAADDVQEGLTELQGDIDGITSSLSGKVDAIVSVDNTVPRFDGIDGQVQTSGVTVDDSDNVSGVAGLTMTGDLDQTGTTAGIATSNSASTVNIATGTGANTVNIGGANTTINMTGTVNNQNVTNLNVTDKVITINDGGAAASGAVAGIEVEEDGTATGSVVTSSDRNSWEFKAPNTAGIATLTPGASNDTVTMNAATQTLTNKTLTAPIINGGTVDGGTASNTNKIVLPAETSANLDALTDDQGSVAYDTTKGKPVYNDGANWKVLGSGSGVGGISYFEGIDLATDTTNISTYDDTGAYVDGTGGSPSVITIARNTTTPLDSDGDLKISKSASDGTGEGVTLLSDTIDIADRGRKLWIRFEWDGTDANYVSEDMVMYAYDVTNSEILTVIPVAGFVQDSNGLATLPAMKTQVLGYVIPKETCTSIRVSLHLLSDSATAAAWDCFVARPRLSPEASVPGAIITEWQSYTPTFTGFGTVSTQSFRWRRVGSNLEVRGRLTVGTPTPTEARLSLPVGLSSASTISTLEIAGDAARNQGASTTFFRNIVLIEPSVSYFTFGVQQSVKNSLTKQNATDVVTAGDILGVTASVPIQGWEASAALSTTEVGLQTVQVLANKTSGTHTSTGNWQDVSWTEDVDNWASFNGTTFTAPKPMNVLVNATVRYASNGTGFRALRINQNGNNVAESPTSSASVDSTGKAIVFAGLKLAKGDTVKIEAYQNSGGNLNYDTASPSQNRLSITEVPDFTTFATFKDNADVELYLDSPSGHGSTNTKIRNGYTVRKSTGSGVYYDYTASSATLGASVTIKVPGLYSVRTVDGNTAAVTIVGISVNCSTLTTTIDSVTYAGGKRACIHVSASNSNTGGEATATLRLSAGDVIRPHQGGVSLPNYTGDSALFQLIRVGN